MTSQKKKTSRELDDEFVDELMDWMVGAYEEGGNQSPVVDLTQYQVRITPQGIQPIQPNQTEKK